MNNIDFAAEFLYINFDDILMQNNSPFLQSEPLYLQHKDVYMSNTVKNYATFKELVSKLQQYDALNSSPPNPSKITYTFTDDAVIEDLNNQLKSLVLLQRNAFQNFLHHVNMLSSTSVLHPEPSKRKTLLEKMGITTSTRKRR